MWHRLGVFALLVMAHDAGAADQPAATARCRYLHAAPGTPAVSFFLDGAEAVKELAYGSLTPYVSVPAGPRNVKVVLPGGADLLDDRDTTCEAGLDYTIVLRTVADQPRLLRLLDRVPEGDGRGHVRGVHLAVSPPVVAFGPRGDPPLATLATGQTTRPVAAAGEQRYAFRAPDLADPLAQVGPVAVAARTTLTLFLIGRPDGPEAERLRVVEDVQPWPDPASAPPPQAAAPTASPTRLRVVHVVPGLDGLEGLLDGRPVTRTLTFGTWADYTTVASGGHFRARQAGQPVVDRELQLDAGEPYTLLLHGSAEQPQTWLLRDEPAPPEAVLVRVVHAASGLGEIDLQTASGASLAKRLTQGRYTPYQTTAPGPVRLDLAAAGQDVVLRTFQAAFEPGAAYTVLVAGALGSAHPAAGLGLRLLKDG